MRQETAVWLRQAEADLETARITLDAERYYAASWFCQQAAEKALKALYIEQQGQLAPKIHDLIRLARLVDTPDRLQPLLAPLNDAFTTVRYPGATDQAPVDAVTGDEARSHIEMAEEVVVWVNSQLA